MTPRDNIILEEKMVVPEAPVVAAPVAADLEEARDFNNSINKKGSTKLVEPFLFMLGFA